MSVTKNSPANPLDRQAVIEACNRRLAYVEFEQRWEREQSIRCYRYYRWLGIGPLRKRSDAEALIAAEADGYYLSGWPILSTLKTTLISIRALATAVQSSTVWLTREEFDTIRPAYTRPVLEVA